MKILTTISAVVFLMILTTGLAAAKKPPVPTFPFTATGFTFYVTDTGTETEDTTDITVYEAGNGLFNGTIYWNSYPIPFAAALDSAGVYNLNGEYLSSYPVTGKFTITYVKHKGFEMAIQWGFPGYSVYVAGTLSQ
jgi:hypothetical protein